MKAKGGRPRTFPGAIVPLALKQKDRTGGSWEEVARDLGVSPGTLRARVSDYRRESGSHKTPALPSDEQGPIVRSSEVEMVRPPVLCSLCGMVHSSEVPCP